MQRKGKGDPDPGKKGNVVLSSKGFRVQGGVSSPINISGLKHAFDRVDRTPSTIGCPVDAHRISNPWSPSHRSRKPMLHHLEHHAFKRNVCARTIAGENQAPR